MQHVNFYDILQVHPRAEPETIQRVYKLFAARYHPDNQRTGDAERFRLIREAYETLIDPERRAEYDKKFDLKQPEPLEVFLNREFSDGIDAEYMVRVGVLCLLYARRRANPDYAALSFLDLENLMAFPREHLSFAIWYLRSKKYILQDDRSSFIITSDGVDYLEVQIRDKKDLYEIFRAAETGLMISTKALLGKHQG
jgi:curved DNA-binding protein CbpA